MVVHAVIVRGELHEMVYRGCRRIEAESKVFVFSCWLCGLGLELAERDGQLVIARVKE